MERTTLQKTILRDHNAPARFRLLIWRPNVGDCVLISRLDTTHSESRDSIFGEAAVLPGQCPHDRVWWCLRGARCAGCTSQYPRALKQQTLSRRQFSGRASVSAYFSWHFSTRIKPAPWQRPQEECCTLWELGLGCRTDKPWGWTAVDSPWLGGNTKGTCDEPKRGPRG